MTAASQAPDVLARPLALALKKLEAAGWQARIVRAEPSIHHPGKMNLLMSLSRPSCLTIHYKLLLVANSKGGVLTNGTQN